MSTPNDATWKPHDIFIRALLARGLAVKEMTADGCYVVDVAGSECTVSLDNVARNAIRDNDPSQVERFVDGLIASMQPLPLWPEARRGIISLAEAFREGMEGVIRDQVSQELQRVLSYTDPDFERLQWLTDADLTAWRVRPDDVLSAAEENMAGLMDRSRLEVSAVQGTPLGYFDSPCPFKASLLFAPNFKQSVASQIGWPVLAVAPCRDFLYLWPAEGNDLIRRMGGLVATEYERSGYPLTTEVLRMSDDGIEAVGRFETRGDHEQPGR
jgi:hypothetical protein